MIINKQRFIVVYTITIYRFINLWGGGWGGEGSCVCMCSFLSQQRMGTKRILNRHWLKSDLATKFQMYNHQRGDS